MADTVVTEWGFQLPARERSRIYPAASESEARVFVAAYPEFQVVRRTVISTDWVAS